MPRFKQTTPKLRRDGPILEVQVEPVLAAQKVMQVDGDEISSVPVRALIDTGASGTLVQASVIEKLGLEQIGTVLLTTPSTTRPLVRYQYHVRIVLSRTIAFETNIVEGALVGQDIECLIGRDILEQVLFTYDGPNSRFSLSLKSSEKEQHKQ